MSSFFAALGQKAIGAATGTLAPAIPPLFGDAGPRDAAAGFVEQASDDAPVPSDTRPRMDAAPVPAPAAPAAAALAVAPARQLAVPVAAAPVAIPSSANAPEPAPQPAPDRRARVHEPLPIDRDRMSTTAAAARPSADERTRGPWHTDREYRILETRRVSVERADAPVPAIVPEPAPRDSDIAAVLARVEALAVSSNASPTSTDAASAPIVRISIGRIEVRAAATAPPTPAPRVAPGPAAGPSLADFLAKPTRLTP